MDQRSRSKDRRYRNKLALVERILRELHARFRYELLTGDILYTLKEPRIFIEEWRKHYNTK